MSIIHFAHGEEAEMRMKHFQYWAIHKRRRHFFPFLITPSPNFGPFLTPILGPADIFYVRLLSKEKNIHVQLVVPRNRGSQNGETCKISTVQNLNEQSDH